MTAEAGSVDGHRAGYRYTILREKKGDTLSYSLKDPEGHLIAGGTCGMSVDLSEVYEYIQMMIEKHARPSKPGEIHKEE